MAATLNPGSGSTLLVRGSSCMISRLDALQLCRLPFPCRAMSGADVVIGEVERVVARDGRAAGVVVKGRAGVVDADAVVLTLGPWFGRLDVVREGGLYRMDSGC